MCVFPYFVIKVQFSLKKTSSFRNCLLNWLLYLFLCTQIFLCITVCTLLILPFYNQSSKKHVITTPLFSHHQKIYRVHKLKLSFWKKKTLPIEELWWIWRLKVNVCKFHLKPGNFVDSIMGHSVWAGRANKTKSKIGSCSQQWPNFKHFFSQN